MQGIYNYIPERKQASRVYNVAAILYLCLMLPVMLFPVLNIIITLVITFMRGIYNHIPETNHVSKVYSSVAAVLYLQSVLHVMLFRL
jgi:hypothetical protein